MTTFTQRQIQNIVFNQLAIDLNCNIEDFKKTGILFTTYEKNDNQRPFIKQDKILEATTLGNITIIQCSKDYLDFAKEQFNNKSREDIFAAPFLFGHTLCYLPDLKRMSVTDWIDSFEYQFYNEKEVSSLYAHPCFEYALQYDKQHPCPDIIALSASYQGKIIAVAGASKDTDLMWQVGIDVCKDYQGKGLAVCLVSQLSKKILDLGKVPYYCTASSNIPSQLVAHRCGYKIAWTSTYHHIFDGSSPYDKIIHLNTTNRDEK